MKTVTLILSMLVFMLAACSDKKNQETIDHFLSQPRDADLLGWWKCNIENESTFDYWYFKEVGIISALSYIDGRFSHYSESQYYWYTKKDDRNILYRFHPYGGIYASDYGRDYYKVENDSLWVSSGIEGDSFYRKELNFFAVRTTEPEEYENR
jgi:hypothetical protein